MRRAARAVGALRWTAAVMLGGCCSYPSAAKFLPQDDHYTTLRGFLYAIEVGQWEEAYTRLTEESRKDFSALKMWLAFAAKLKIPETDVPFAVVIENHDPFYRPDDRGLDSVEYRLIYDPEEEPGEEDNVYLTRLILVNKPMMINGVRIKHWEIDLLRSFTQG